MHADCLPHATSCLHSDFVFTVSLQAVHADCPPCASDLLALRLSLHSLTASCACRLSPLAIAARWPSQSGAVRPTSPAASYVASVCHAVTDVPTNAILAIAQTAPSLPQSAATVAQRLRHCLAVSVTFTVTVCVGRCCRVAGTAVTRCVMEGLVGVALWRVPDFALVERYRFQPLSDLVFA